MKETYKVKLSKHIVIGDPSYFQSFEGSELERLTVDYNTPNHFTDARVTIESNPCEEMPELTLLDMTIYLATKSTMHTYLEGMMYKSQKQLNFSKKQWHKVIIMRLISQVKSDCLNLRLRM